jgi:hypothetical protein
MVIVRASIDHCHHDAGAAIENLLLAAWEKGLGGCWIASIDRDRLRTILNVPEHLDIDSVISLGYPAEQPVGEEMTDSVKYYLDDDDTLHVPKRRLADIQLEADIRQSGIAVTKRALAICQERRYAVSLIVAALRGTYHMTELAGGDLILSIAPAFQGPLQSPDLPREERIGRAVEPAVLDRLRSMPEFRRAFEPDGMRPEEFISYGVTQRTLAQFAEVGWRLMETFKL